ncbi:unnamed protein product [Candidula unifasciata]|uniref:Uncharacterized protein n=1 Tax=Candidula unifasciata TaxID=100452 RepID=A0A8S3ZYG4_9EUPU|nr:unnamed protein product [Candidula unifasciata]
MCTTLTGRGLLKTNIERESLIFNDKMSLLTDDQNHQTAALSLKTATMGTKWKSSIDKQATLKKKLNQEAAVNGGFSFGKKSTPLKLSHSLCREEGDGNDVGEVYGIEMQELATVTDRMAVSAGRRVIAQRIGNIGRIAQNVSLDYVSQTDDPELKPKPVEIESNEYIVDDDMPMQIDIKWKKPENADKFKSLTYKIDIKPESIADNWTTVGLVKFPVFRVYHTDGKLLLGKVHVARQSHDLIYLLRCQVLGEVSQTSESCVLESTWSRSVALIFRGYRDKPQADMFFNL